MIRSGGLTIILLCGALAGCVTASAPAPAPPAATMAVAPPSDAYLLPTLLGSLAMVEAECRTQIVERPATANELRDFILTTLRELRSGGWPFGIVQPCGPTSLHCPDSKCPSMGFGEVICTPGLSLDIPIDAAFNLLEMEIVLRFAHEPSLRMMKYLDGHLKKTYDRVRARRR